MKSNKEKKRISKKNSGGLQDFLESLNTGEFYKEVPKKEINIIEYDDNYILIEDIEKGYKGKIHQSLIRSNDLEITDNKTNISESLYNAWFEEAIEKAFQERCDLFYLNIPMFVEKQDIILTTPKFYSIMSPKAFQIGMYIGSKQITLGEMLLLWEHEAKFYRKCDCGGKAVIYNFAGSVLSGTLFSAPSICVQCGKNDNIDKSYGFGSLMFCREKYNPIKPISKRPASIKNLIDFLEGRTDKIENAESDELEYILEDTVKIRIGKKAISNNTFASIIGKKDIRTQ